MQVQLKWSLTNYSDFIAAEQLLHTYSVFDYFYFSVIACMGKHIIMTDAHRDYVLLVSTLLLWINCSLMFISNNFGLFISTSLINNQN